MSNIDERIKQCDVDIAALEEQKQKLLEEKKENKLLRPGDIVSGLFGQRLVVELNSGCLIAVDRNGCQRATDDKNNFRGCRYTKVGRCTGFNIA